MDRLIKISMAACAIGAGMVGQVQSQPAETAAPSAGEAVAADATSVWARSLCAAIEEGVQLLTENHLTPTDGAAKAALLEALIQASDPSAVFLDEAELAERNRQRAEQEWDTGLTLVALEEGLPKVAAVRTNSPAAAAGILPGEWIEKVGGDDILTGSTLQYVRRLLGEGGEAMLEIGVRGADERSRIVSVERQRREGSALTDVEDLPAGIGYVRTTGIFSGSGTEIVAALESWQAAGASGAILDLRGASGLAEQEILAVAARFVPAGSVLYSLSDRQGRELLSAKSPAAAAVTMPLMVLVDEETTGAAELLAAVLGGSVKGAMVIGRETAGDPLIREPRKLSTGRFALLATRQVQVADGTVYSGAGGIVPDVVITPAALNETVYEPEMPSLRPGKTLSDEEKEDKALRDRTRNDTYLRRATDVLLGLKALGYDRKP